MSSVYQGSLSSPLYRLLLNSHSMRQVLRESGDLVKVTSLEKVDGLCLSQGSDCGRTQETACGKAEQSLQLPGCLH